MQLAVNILIRFVDDNVIERILWIDSLYEYAFTFDMNKSSCKTKVRIIEELEAGIKEGHIEIEENDPFIVIVDENELTMREKEMRERTYKVIAEIERKPDIFYPNRRRDLILSACQKYEISEKTLYKYLKRYWKGGMTKNTLIPEFSNCGRKGEEKGSAIVKRGRPRKYVENIKESKEGVNIDKDIKRIFNVALEKYYYNGKQNSITTAYELMKKEFFTEGCKIINGVKIPLLVDEKEIPTIGQFRYWLKKEKNLRKEISKRRSTKNYNLNHRPLLGDSTQEINGPGSLYQIDATIGDVYLVSTYNRDWIIGRPIIYMVIDTFSRMVVGIYIGLEGPSWVGASMALANSAMNKVRFCKEYGIEITEEDWSTSYLPDSILADRGEFEGIIPENLIQGLHIKIQNTSSYRGDMKAIVERYFHTLNTKTKPFLPGFINQDFRQRGGKDYRLDAKLDLNQFTRIIIKCVLYHNNQHYLKDYNRSLPMIEDGVDCIPKKLWDWGIKHISGKLRSFPEDIVKLNLMPSDTATVTAKGIRFKKMYYSCEKGIKDRWFEKARNHGSWKVDVCYDSRNMNYIYLKEDGRFFEKCYLLEHQEKYIDKTIEEITHLIYMEGVNERSVKQETSQGNIDLMSEIEAIVKEAESQVSESSRKGSKREKIVGIRENRKVEKEINRQNEYFDLEKREEQCTHVADFNTDLEIENQLLNMDLLKKKQKVNFDEYKTK